MKKKSLFPLIYGIIAALLAFIAVLFICLRTFRLNQPLAVAIAGLAAVFFFIISWFRGHASVEIKRITAEFRLTDQDLADITGMKKSDFPIYHNKLQLILPKRYWARILAALQKYEEEHS